MATFNANFNLNFDANKDNIAVVIKQFTLKKKGDKFQRYSEPYIVSMAIDENGANNPAIDFNVLSFPNVKKGDTVDFIGQGLLVYGPKNPGSFLAFSILFMESDQDIRDLGKTISEIVKSEAVKIGAKALLKAVPTYGTAINLLTSITEVVSNQMQKNKDDELYRRSGTLLRGVLPPYDILRVYKGENDYIDAHVSTIPLISSNQLGQQPYQIKLK